MVFPKEFEREQLSKISKTCLRILANLINAGIWMVSARLPISSSSSPFPTSLKTFPHAPITIIFLLIWEFFSPALVASFPFEQISSNLFLVFGVISLML